MRQFTRKRKTNPDKENSIKCPVCRAYGKIITQTVVEDKTEPEIDEDSGCYQALFCTAACLHPDGRLRTGMTWNIRIEKQTGR